MTEEINVENNGVNTQNDGMKVEATIEEVVEESPKGEPQADKVIKKFDLDPNFAENLRYLGAKVKDDLSIVCNGNDRKGYLNDEDRGAEIIARVNIERELSDLTLPLFVNLTDRTFSFKNPYKAGPYAKNYGSTGRYVETELSPAMLGHIKVVLESQYGSETAKTDLYEILETLADNTAMKIINSDFKNDRYVNSLKQKCESYTQRSDAQKSLNQLKRNKPSWIKKLFGAGKKYRTKVEELEDEIAMHDQSIKTYVAQRKEERIANAKETDSDSKWVHGRHLANHLGDQIRVLEYFAKQPKKLKIVRLNKANPYFLLMKLPVEAKAFMTGVLKMMEDKDELTEEVVTAKENYFSKPVRLEHTLRYAKEIGQLHKAERFMRMYNNLKPF